jgi:hypothetical protein
MLGGPSFCKSLSIKDLRKVGPQKKCATWHGSCYRCPLPRVLILLHVVWIHMGVVSRTVVIVRREVIARWSILLGAQIVTDGTAILGEDFLAADLSHTDLEFVVHCGYSLQCGRRSVNNFCADFRQKKITWFFKVGTNDAGGPLFL